MTDNNASRLGEIFFHRGDLLKAREWYGKAVHEARQRGSHDELTHMLGNLGNVHALLEDHVTAEAHYQELLTL